MQEEETINKKSAEMAYELGKLYCDRGDLKIAREKFVEASEIYHTYRDFAGYLKCQRPLLRIYAEMEDLEAICVTKDHLQNLAVNDNVELNAKIYYALALCSSYQGQAQTALEYLEKSLALALAHDEKEDICYAINGLAIVYFSLGRYEDALKEIYNLQVFFQVLNLPELKLSSQLMNGHILRKMGKYDQALDIFWQCYDLLKTQKNMYMYISLLYAMAVTFVDSGDTDMGRMYAQLAKRSVDADNLKYLARHIESLLDEMGDHQDERYDLIFKTNSNLLVERKKGKVDFRNQFILLDLLRLFLKHPGEVYSKEALVEKVWKQNYDPRVHDNKIYVTIKRLRRMIEPDFDKPKYIFRAKNGYYLNKSTRVLFEQ